MIVLHDVTQLRRLEQVRAEFIDNVSHELRTPLAAIIGYLETLIDEPILETPNNRKFVHVAHQHAERLSRLVDDLRSLSEIESGKVVLRGEAVGLKDLVDEVSEMFQPEIQKKHLHITNQIEVEATVWADRDRVIQILLNLVDNAMKYTPEGGSISFYAQRQNERMLLHVNDTGRGFLQPIYLGSLNGFTGWIVLALGKREGLDLAYLSSSIWFNCWVANSVSKVNWGKVRA